MSAMSPVLGRGMSWGEGDAVKARPHGSVRSLSDLIPGDKSPSTRVPSIGRVNSMLRLADEAVLVPSPSVASTHTRERRLSTPNISIGASRHGSGASSRPTSRSGSRPASASRPGSAQSAAGLIRLPDEPSTPAGASDAESSPKRRTGPGTPVGASATQTRKASLARIPSEPSPSHSPPACSGFGVEHFSANMSASSPTSAAASTSLGVSSKLRDRLNKNLSVSTDNHNPTPALKQVQVFRTLRGEESITDLYELGEEIYNGGVKGRIVMGKRRRDGAEVALKIRTKQPNRNGERTWRTIMSQVHGIGGLNRHVLNIMEIVETSDYFYVIMPRCNGGELFEFLATETEVPEAECKRIIREILTAVGHLHDNNLIHRDIKPENIMFDVEDLPSATPKTVKLIDFDTCFEWTPMTPKSRRFVGTPGYIAPEALLGEITPQSDLWSIGVILYILMTGEMPWSSLVSLEDGVVGSPGAQKMYIALKNEQVEWDLEPWPDFPLARDLCQKLLAFKVEDRLSTVSQALSHAWLTDG